MNAEGDAVAHIRTVALSKKLGKAICFRAEGSQVKFRFGNMRLIAITPDWEAVGALFVATLVVLWSRRKRKRPMAITPPKGHHRAEYNQAGPFGQPSKPVSLEVRVFKVGGKFTLLIPLEAGGNELIRCSRGIASIAGEDLKVTIPDWLGDNMGLEEGSLVRVDNEDGKFNITAIEAPPSYTRRN
jgi:hypothetical protein